MLNACLLLLLLLGSTDKTISEPTRSSKIQTILFLQDQRVASDPRLTVFLTDSDPAVRERAAIACANLQDTLLLPALLKRLRDDDTMVREAAAFAIGQTGPFLSADGKADLEKECLAICASPASPPRLFEEIGKFGTATGFSGLVSLAQSGADATEREAIIMGIARFAIRGIVSDSATRFLVGLADSDPNVSWKAVYALQRTAPLGHIDLRTAITLTRNHDPLVRMNAALLLGKLGDTLDSVPPLLRLSSGEIDWRVRVNALNALGKLSKTPSSVIVERIARAFADSNEHVALAALAVFGEMLKGSGHIPEAAEGDLWSLAESGAASSVRRQAEALTTIAKIERAKAFRRLARVHSRGDWSEARLAAAIGLTGDTLALPVLLKKSSHRNPLLASSALEGLRYLAELNPGNSGLLQAIAACAIDRLQSNDISLLSGASSMLADTLLRTASAVPALLRSLERLREPDDVEAIQQIVQTLGELRDGRAIDPLRRRLSSSDRTVAESAADALQAITGRSYRSEIHVTIKPKTNEKDSAFLAHLSDTVLVHMQTSVGPVLLELYPRIAPFTVMSFIRLAYRKFYDGLLFHRVVPNFVVQGGDPRGDGWGGPGYSIRSEFSLLHYERGTLGMASAGKDTEGSQFFITHSPQPHLDGRYTIFGRVRKGMDVVDRLQVGDKVTRLTLSPEAAVGK